MDAITTLITTAPDAQRMLKGSVLLKAEQEAHKKTALKLDTVTKFLCVWLDEFEGAWDSDEQCASPEIAQDYITQATFMKAHFGRNDAKRIQYVQEWLDNYLPFGN